MRRSDRLALETPRPTRIGDQISGTVYHYPPPRGDVVMVIPYRPAPAPIAKSDLRAGTGPKMIAKYTVEDQSIDYAIDWAAAGSKASDGLRQPNLLGAITGSSHTWSHVLSPCPIARMARAD
jgi:hypothetical protein